MNNITFVIFTYNEEKRIERVIKNLKDYGTVLIADNKSTDRTLEIAMQYNCEIFIREKEYVFVENQELLDLIYPFIKTDWLCFSFADEMIDVHTLQKIAYIINKNKYEIINLYVKNYYYGLFFHEAFAPRINKIFKKRAIDFTDNIIHHFGRVVVDDSLIYKMPSQYFIHQFKSDTIESDLHKINKYTNKENEFSYNQKNIFFNIFLNPIKLFFFNYLFKKGYKAGIVGFNFALIQILYYIIKYMKVIEKKAELSAEAIEVKNNEIKDAILEKIYK